MLKRVIAERRGYVDWERDEDGWAVWLLAPERVEFRGQTLHGALAWCLVFEDPAGSKVTTA